VLDELLPLLPHAASVSAEARPSAVNNALPRLAGTAFMVPSLQIWLHLVRYLLLFVFD
jgi:hypothetical protein